MTEEPDDEAKTGATCTVVRCMGVAGQKMVAPHFEKSKNKRSH